MPEDDWPDEIDYDPRWEVQPEPDHDPGSNGRTVVMALITMTVLAALIAWGLMEMPPAL